MDGFHWGFEVTKLSNDRKWCKFSSPTLPASFHGLEFDIGNIFAKCKFPPTITNSRNPVSLLRNSIWPPSLAGSDRSIRSLRVEFSIFALWSSRILVIPEIPIQLCSQFRTSRTLLAVTQSQKRAQIFSSQPINHPINNHDSPLAMGRLCVALHGVITRHPGGPDSRQHNWR